MLQINENKVNMAKNIKNYEQKGDVMELLKEIRRVSLQIETNSSIYDDMDEEEFMYYS